MAIRVPCKARTICDSCDKGIHGDCGMMYAGDIPGVECLEHGQPKSCHCWCMAHPDHRERLQNELAAFGIR